MQYTYMNKLPPYTAPYRDILLWVSLAVLGFLLGLATLYSAPLFVWLIWLIPASAITWIAMTDPMNGIVIEQDAVTIAAWRAPNPVPMSEVSHMEIDEATNNRIGTYALALKDGTKIALASTDIPNRRRFVAALKAHNIPIVFG